MHKVKEQKGTWGEVMMMIDRQRIPAFLQRYCVKMNNDAIGHAFASRNI